MHEIKLDGWRVQVRVEDGTATIRTRNGHDYSSTFPEIARAARGLDNCIIDGEACAIDKNGVTNFSALQGAMKSDKTDKLILFAFDLLWLRTEDLRTRHLMERKERLQALLPHASDSGKLQFVDHLDFAGANVMARACELGLDRGRGGGRSCVPVC